jgi:hypothetical protein
MRNPSLIFAAALLASNPAFAIGPQKPKPQPPLAFNREDYKVIDLQGKSLAAAAQACPNGALVSPKHLIDEKAHSFGAKAGFNTQIDLFCVTFNAAGQAIVSPVDSRILELTVYSPVFTSDSEANFVLNRGTRNKVTGPTVVVRSALPTELVAGASAPSGTTEPGVLTDAEKYWLSSSERTAYDAEMAKAKTPDERLRVVKSMRAEGVLKNLPKADQAAYKKFITGEIKPAEISAFLDGLLSITNKEDLAKLATIKKGKGAGLHLELADALQDYKAKISSVPLGPDGRPKTPADRDAAVKKVASYRAMLRGGGAHHGGAKTPDGKHPSEAAVALTAAEKDWLTPQQRNSYEEDAKDKAKLTKEILTKYRAFVATNLPSGKEDYAAAVAEMTPAALDAALSKIPHYAGTDVALTDAEISALAAVPAPAGPSALPGEKANATYAREMASVQKDSNGAPKGSEHLHAHEIIQRYRVLLAGAGKTPPGAPAPEKPKEGTPPAGTAGPGEAGPRKTKLTDEELALLTDAERTAYNLAGSDDARADLIAKYQSALDDRKGMTPPKDLQDFAGRNAAQKEKLCDGVPRVVGGGAAAGGQTSGALAQLKTGAANSDAVPGAVDGNTATGDVVPTAKPKPATPDPNGAKPGAITPAQLSAACTQFDMNKTSGGNIAGGGPKDVPTPGSKPGSDKDDSPKEKKPDPNFYRNVANGMGFGIFGLIVGSLFGGPLVMIAAAAIIGGGAFALSKHLNKPKKDG